MRIHFISLMFPPLKAPRSIQIAHLASYVKSKVPLSVIHANSECKIAPDPSLMELDLPQHINSVPPSFLTRLLFSGRGDRYRKMLFPDPYFPWSFDLFRKARSTVAKEDIIVTFGQPMSVHVAGILLKISKPKIRWIAHLSDPWVTNPYSSFNAWTKRINLILERMTFKLADQVIFTSEVTRARTIDRYPGLRNKAEFLCHSYDRRLFPETKVSKKASKVLVLRYIGNFYGGRRAKPLADALLALKELDASLFQRLHIEIVGQSQFNEDFEHIHFKPEVPYIESLALMREADGLVLIDAPATESEFFPSKLVDYLGSGRPILGLTPPGVSRSVLQECGYTCIDPDSSPKFLAEALLAFCNELTQGISGSERKNAENYEISQVGQQFLTIIAPKIGAPS